MRFRFQHTLPVVSEQNSSTALTLNLAALPLCRNDRPGWGHSAKGSQRGTRVPARRVPRRSSELRLPRAFTGTSDRQQPLSLLILFLLIAPCTQRSIDPAVFLATESNSRLHIVEEGSVRYQLPSKQHILFSEIHVLVSVRLTVDGHSAFERFRVDRAHPTS